MDLFTIKKKSVTTTTISTFIRDPNEDDGSGWSYNAVSDGEYLNIDWAGKVRLTQLNTLVSLFEYVIESDVDRNAINDDASFIGTMFLDSEKELEEAKETYKTPVQGAPHHDIFTATAVDIQDDSKRIMSITLNRINSSYYLTVGGVPALQFNSWEIEGILALVKEFIK